MVQRKKQLQITVCAEPGLVHEVLLRRAAKAMADEVASMRERRKRRVASGLSDSVFIYRERNEQSPAFEVRIQFCEHEDTPEGLRLNAADTIESQ